jgi:hypothetical protein
MQPPCPTCRPVCFLGGGVTQAPDRAPEIELADLRHQAVERPVAASVRGRLTLSLLSLPGLPGRGDVRLREILALEQKLRSVDPGTRVGKAVAHVERRRMAALAILSIGFGGDLEFALANADELQVARLKETSDMGSRCRD